MQKVALSEPAPMLVPLARVCATLGVSPFQAVALSEENLFPPILQLQKGGRRFVLRDEFERWVEGVRAKARRNA